jgi:hypothetical protein
MRSLDVRSSPQRSSSRTGAKKLDPYRETARMVLEPWLVQAALARLPHTLSPADQQIIVEATRTPHKVRWPDRWSEYS